MRPQAQWQQSDSGLIIPSSAAPFFWAMDDGPSPYADTGAAGESRDMSAVGTVSDDAVFGGVSLAGSGAVAVADTSGWINSIVSGADAQFSFKVRFKLDDLASNQSIVTKASTTLNERQIITLVRPSTGDLDFIWYATGSGGAFRLVRAAGAVAAGTEYVLDIIYDGTVDTSDGLDRVSIFLNAVEKTTTLPASSGSLPGIGSTSARLSLGGYVGSNGALDGQLADGDFADFSFFDYLISGPEIG